MTNDATASAAGQAQVPPSAGSGVNADAAPPAADPASGAAVAPDGYTSGIAQPQFPANGPLTPQATALPLAGPPVAAPSKMSAQFVWEGILLFLAALGIAVWFGIFDPIADMGGPAGVVNTLFRVLPILVLAMAFGVSLRVGVVNLGVVPIASFAPLAAASLHNFDPWLAWAIVGGGIVALAVVTALLVTLLRMPGWLAGIAMAAIVMLVELSSGLQEQMWGRNSLANQDLTMSKPLMWIIVVGAILLSLVGGLLYSIPPFRRTLAKCRHSVNNATGYSFGAFLLTSVSLIASCVLAAVAGVLDRFDDGFAVVVDSLNGFSWVTLCLVVGIVALGGTGLQGGRGGIFGTLLAAIVVLITVMLLTNIVGNQTIIANALPLGVLLLGLVANAILEMANRPKRQLPYAYAAPAMAVTPAVDETAFNYAPQVPQSYGGPAEQDPLAANEPVTEPDFAPPAAPAETTPRDQTLSMPAATDATEPVSVEPAADSDATEVSPPVEVARSTSAGGEADAPSAVEPDAAAAAPNDASEASAASEAGVPAAASEPEQTDPHEVAAPFADAQPEWAASSDAAGKTIGEPDTAELGVVQPSETPSHDASRFSYRPPAQ